ncbi:helix-turn-helix domain-containing protein [Paenibacillus guangzhouensis]|uniref:helix-turn-helix domain-containing protein n=1 Tax=Paenibacillus guangzhouensis TaxID=1473112 RepID=UPI001266E511|nr:helix-turn-helix domain-containing protein [Paenibacillus guangzhouensis]
MEPRLLLEELEYICKLMFENYKMPTVYIHASGDVAYELTYPYHDNPFTQHIQELYSQLADPEHPAGFPILRTTSFLGNFFAVRIEHDEQFGTIIVGPSLYQEMRKETLDKLIHDYQLPHKHKQSIVQYYEHAPILNMMDLLNASLMLYFLIYRQKLDIVEVLQQNHELEIGDDTIDNIDLDVSNRRQNNHYHHDPAIERSVFNSVRDGNREALFKSLAALPEEQLGVLSKKSHLRSRKNLSIIGIAIATRAAIEGGLHSEVAFTLSDIYIQHIEELTDLKQLKNTELDAFLELTDRVRACNEQSYSKAVTVCQHYIFNHLHEEISLQKLSELTDLHPSYLSQLFKREVGISLSEYTQRKRVEEAKVLLASSEYSLSDICARLNFYDQSYFSKIFKKYTKVTPKQYRNSKNLPST